MIDISLETQKLVDGLVASGRFLNREQVIDEAVKLLHVDLKHDRKVMESAQLSAMQWCEEFEAWASSHRPLSHEADDSRESIYESCGA